MLRLKARQFAGWILRTFKSRQKDLMMTLFNSFVRSRLEYCCPLWSPYLVQEITKLESVQRSFTSKIMGLQEMNYWERLRVYLHVDRSTGAHHRLSAHKHHRCAPDRTGSTQLLFTTNGCEHPARCAPVRSIMTIHVYVVGPCLPCF